MPTSTVIDATKAAVRACRNAFTALIDPSIRQIVPGGYDNMSFHIQIGVPKGAVLDLEKIRQGVSLRPDLRAHRGR